MPKYTVSTRAGTFDIVADREPTQQEAEELTSSYSTEGKKVDDMAKSLSADNPDFMNAAVGVAFDTIPSLVGGAAGFFLGKSKTAATAGSVTGGAIGNFIKQSLQLDRGEIKKIEGADVVRNAIYSAALPGISNLAAQASKNIVKSVAIRAGEASAIAASASVVGSEIKNGRLPTFSEFTQEVLPAAVLGGALGGVQAKYRSDGAFITNPIAANVARAGAGLGAAAVAYNNAVENGDPSPLSKAFLYGSATIGATHIPSFLAKVSSSDARKAVIGPESVLPPSVPNILSNTKDAIEAAQNQAANIGNEVNKLIIKLKGGKAMSDDVLSAMDGKLSTASLPPEIRPYIIEYQRINRSNGELILQELPHITGGLADEIKANAVEGTYYRNTYAAHNDKAQRGVEYATPEASKAFRDEIIANTIAQTPSTTLEEAGRKADVVMTRMLRDVAYLTSGEAGVAVSGEAASSLRRKTDISPLGKAFLGEVRDPGAVMKNSLSAQSRIIYEAKRDKAIVEVLEGAGLASKTKNDNLTQLMIPADAPTLRRDLAGLYTSEITAQAYKELSSPYLLGDGVINTTWMTMSSLSKASKTVLNPLESITPQIFGNMALAASAFKANPLDIIRDLRTSAFSVFGKGAGKMTAEAKILLFRQIEEMQSLGMAKGGVDIQELKTLANMSFKGGSYQSVFDKFSKVYGFPDTVFRYSIYKSNLKELLSFEPIKGMATLDRMKELKKQAAKITNDQFPTYDKIARRYRQLSAVGAANVFGAFEFEVMRNSMNQLRYAKNLITEGARLQNTEMQKAGIKRLIAFAAVAGGTGAIATSASRQLGTTEEQEKAANALIPNFDQGKAVVTKFNKDGRMMYAPINYLFPHANMTSSIIAAMKGENPLPYLKSSFMGSDMGPLATSAIESLTNTYWGTKIPISEPRNNLALTERFLQQSFGPGLVTGTLSRALKAYQGETNKLGAAPSWNDVALRMAAVRSNTYDVLAMGSAAARNAVDPVIGQQTGYRQILKQALARTGGKGFGGINAEEIYNSRNAAYMQGQDRIAEIYQAMKVAQRSAPNIITDDKIVEALKTAGVPNSLIISAIYHKEKEQMPMGLPESDTEIIANIASLKISDSAKEKLIAKEAKGDDNRLEKLERAYDDYLRGQDRGVDIHTRLFSGLDVASGQRAASIYKSLEGMNGNRALFDKLEESGVITSEVMQQLEDIDAKKVAAGRPTRI
jgi:hypothetical protein